MTTLDLAVFEELKDLMDGDMSDILEMYEVDSAEQIDGLKTSISGDDLTSTIAIAHTLKSSSANLGAMDLAKLCKKMEHDGRENTLSNPAELLEKIIAELARVQTELTTNNS
ncbi:MAG: Hpt domain-containing protein [Methylococcales bacterium]|jgi:HPt (histidine-containing phosphotransfer) domain-containing protein|nr:Hpt domain-containing protein [Methylococcales bacterium]